jgi:hypothetical protein
MDVMRRLGRILLNSLTIFCAIAFLASVTGWVLTRQYYCSAGKTRSVTRVHASNKILSVKFGISDHGLEASRETELRPLRDDARPPPHPGSWEWHAVRSRPGPDVNLDDLFTNAVFRGWHRWGFAHISFDNPFAGLGSSEGQPCSYAVESWIVPWWPLILGFSLLPAARVFRTLRTRVRRRRRPGRCQQCGYDLRATPDRCPECGTIP